MRRNVITSRLERPHAKAAALLENINIGNFAIVDTPGRVVGIIAEADIFEASAGTLNCSLSLDLHRSFASEKTLAWPGCGALVLSVSRGREEARFRFRANPLHLTECG